MIVLNYHRVESGGAAGFYTLLPAKLSQHLQDIRKLGLKVIGTSEALSAKVDKGMVMLHFDDGTEDHAKYVLPILQSERVTGVFFINTAKIDQPGYLTVDQVKQLAAAGNDIECHGHSHRRMDRMAPDELDHELATSVALIHEWTGRAPRLLAPPGGFINQQVIRASQRHQLGTLRTMRWNTNSIPLHGMLDCLVVTGASRDEQIRQWLQGRGIRMLRTTYLIKQGIRSLLPFDLYLKTRSRFCSGSIRNP